MSTTQILPVLYSFRRCPYAMRARMAIILSSVECELREILLKNKPEEMLSLSPKGTVPVLAFDNTVLDESMDVINWAFAKDSSKFLKYSSSESKLSIYFVELFDAKFKYHLDRYKYASRYDKTSDDHQGECFVFDDRVALNHKLEVGSFDMCHGCRMPITESDKLSEQFQKGISCPNCFDTKTPEQKRRYAERIKQIDLAKQRNKNYHGTKSS